MLSSTLHVFARRYVDRHIVPLLGRNFREPTLLQRLASRDDLHDRCMTVFEIARDARDRARRLHRGDEVIEEALLRALEGRARGGLGLWVERPMERAGDPGRLHRGVEIVVDDLLSRGSGNAEERGVVLQSCGTFRHVLHIIL